MIEQIYFYFSIERIYMWLNIGILPFWVLLLFFPQTRICRIFVTSVFPMLLLTVIDIYLFLEVYENGFSFVNTFNLYLSIHELQNLFSDTNFTILFWIHFLAINLFCGSWIVKDYQKTNMPKVLVFFPLILTYFIGPIGLSIYWFIRIFFTKKINLYE